eukprot:NODE_2380_length_1434_cov_148.459191_g2263_i0.p1 GENE.NODE_2380_length_1434_cov_148.459191_g2263_i0~~NODE_2380_length_1434_cov_148.459191_g2263_i0.p1  ORF type:complete len:375 (-),score=89.85 NODE_2380_length_1434_cov_148.459191_g2263_i0:108-1232(-)
MTKQSTKRAAAPASEPLLLKKRKKTPTAVSKPKPVEEKEEEEDDGLFVGFDEPPKPKVEKRKKADDSNLEAETKRMYDEEKEVDALEQARADGNTPTTPEGFRLLLISSPNCSFTWCQFMAFWILRGEIEKARNVAEQGLKTINFKESKELFNLWTAYINLESEHGTAESASTVFHRAAKGVDDELKMYQHFVKVLNRFNRTAKIIKLYRTMCSKFPEEVDVWTSYYRFLVQRGESQGSTTKPLMKSLQKSCMEALLKDKHVQVLTKFGCIELREGNVERGRVIFEELLATYPKRTDVWSVYLDMELHVLRRGLHNMKNIRHIFERVTTLNLSPKKMQGFLTRYMAFEKEYGTEKTQAAVQEKAVAYVEQKCAQ